MTAPAAQMATMDADIVRVRALSDAALQVAQDAANSWFADPAASSVLTQVNAQRNTLETWATKWRGWVQAGVDDTGAAYPLDFWRRIGQDLSDFFAYASKQASYTLLSTVVEDTVKAAPQAAVDLAKKANPLNWNLSTQLMVGGAVVVVLLVVFRPYVNLLGAGGA